MQHWFKQTDTGWVFRFDNDNAKEAVAAALACGKFVADDEDEWVDDAAVSCFNCQYRRWLAVGFTCCLPGRV
ncbi:hypothetical protein [Shewanella sp. GXUN23E]|uniref:hypothetical protein n=1 Tax=Shewanella sp. GXUN23E TaxID=3422498 RepID=UPI003D7ECF71